MDHCPFSRDFLADAAGVAPGVAVNNPSTSRLRAAHLMSV